MKSVRCQHSVDSPPCQHENKSPTEKPYIFLWASMGNCQEIWLLKFGTMQKRTRRGTAAHLQRSPGFYVAIARHVRTQNVVESIDLFFVCIHVYLLDGHSMTLKLNI